jgi:hypothetical protein
MTFTCTRAHTASIFPVRIERNLTTKSVFRNNDIYHTVVLFKFGLYCIAMSDPVLLKMDNDAAHEMV